MNTTLKFKSKLNNQKGATAPIVAILLLFVFIPLGAITLDLGHLYVARNELQNAADAAALAGAAELYDADFTTVNTGANKVAYDTAIQNNSEGISVEVDGWDNSTTDDNTHDIQRGHWAFKLGSVAKPYFKASNSTAVVPIEGVSTEELNENDDFINAVYVKVRRETFSIVMFFARIFNVDFFPMTAKAVAYLGYTGSLEPEDVDLPVALCRESIIECEEGDPDNCWFDCNIGRMINSGSDATTHNTAGWTNYSQPDPPGPDCDSANANELGDILKDAAGNCQGKNQVPLIFGNTIGAIGGQVTTVLDDLSDCWESGANELICNPDTDPPGTVDIPIDYAPVGSPDGIPDIPWQVTLPVILCPGNNVENCPTLVGAATVNLVWMTPKGNVDWTEAPTKMYLEIPTITQDCSNPDPQYGDFWPDDVNTTPGGDPILGEGINSAYGDDNTSVLDVMQDAYSDKNEFDQIKQKLDKDYPGWENKELGELFYDDYDPADGSHGTNILNDNKYEGAVRWASFVKTFALKNVDDEYAPYQDGGIYFLPDCQVHEPRGDTGGENYGIRADRPVLVYHELLHDLDLLPSS